MTDSPKFKDYYNADLAQKLATDILAVYSAFDQSAFVEQVATQVEGLELKARVAIIAAALQDHLPAIYLEALEILVAILGPEIPRDEGMFDEGFYYMPVAYFVEVYGLDHFDQSMTALYEITKRHTAEFAIRPFLRREQARTLALLHQWVDDESFHVRRLVSEGTRPRLPWGPRLPAFIKDPSPVLPLLEKLKNDSSAYVRRSVANHLNDITKDHSDLVIERLTQWQAEATPETEWITRHALRGLVKQGHPDALALLGFGEAKVSLSDLQVSPNLLYVGETLTISFTLHSDATDTQNLLIDYLIHFVKANQKTSPKVFKFTTRTLAVGETLCLTKKQPIKPVTTRRYYAGRHRVEIQVNGRILGGVDFELVL